MMLPRQKLYENDCVIRVVITNTLLTRLVLFDELLLYPKRRF